MQFIIDFILTIFNGNAPLSVLMFAIVPVIEIRGAIPLGVNMGLSIGESFAYSLIGSLICSLMLLLILPVILKLFEKTKIYKKILNVLLPKINKLENCKINMYLGLLLFVAIPLPLTGVCTACLLASMFKLKTWKSFIFINAGNIIAGIIISLITIFLGTFSIYITLVFMIMFVALMVLYLTKLLK